MPKIIAGIEEKIYEAAFALFTEKGYNAVNMSMVAQKTGIAVGTLYNYHENKKDLFLHVLEKSWQETLIKLDQVLENEENEQKLIVLINTLYTHISERKGIGHELLISSELRDVGFEFINKMRKKIIEVINQALIDYILYNNCQMADITKERLSHLIFIEIIDTKREFSGEKESNIKFIMKVVDGMLIKQ